MSYGGYLAGNPLFWALLSGIGIGATLAAATWRTRQSRRPKRAASRKWSLAFLAMSVAVASVAAGVLLPPGLGMLSADSLWALGAGVLIFAPGLRFPRAVGIPLLFVLGTVVVLGAWMVRGLEPIREPVDLARITVLSIREDGLSLEVEQSTLDGAAGTVMAMSSEVLRVQADVVDVAKPLFFLGAPRFARFAGPGTEAMPRLSPLLTVLQSQGLVQRQTLVAEERGVNLLRTYWFIVGPDSDPILASRRL
jgi:hypothetical protein